MGDGSEEFNNHTWGRLRTCVRFLGSLLKSWDLEIFPDRYELEGAGIRVDSCSFFMLLSMVAIPACSSISWKKATRTILKFNLSGLLFIRLTIYYEMYYGVIDSFSALRLLYGRIVLC